MGVTHLLALLLFGVMCVVCLVIGVRIGQSAAKGETVKMGELNPINAIREHSERKQAVKEYRQEMDRTATILRNIDIYDGTSAGQMEVPKG
jgi:hypothetical protein